MESRPERNVPGGFFAKNHSLAYVILPSIPVPCPSSEPYPWVSGIRTGPSPDPTGWSSLRGILLVERSPERHHVKYLAGDLSSCL